MFENDDGTLGVHVELLVEPSVTTPVGLPDQLSFWSRPKESLVHVDSGRLYSNEYFAGIDWRDHLTVLAQVVEDEIPILKDLVFHDATVVVDIRWTGSPGAAAPRVTPEDLGLLYFPGVEIELHANWDFGNHAGSLVHSSLYVYGPDPDRVSDFLGEPSKVYRLGDPMVSRGQVFNHRKQNVWILNSDDFCTSSNSFEHQKAIYERIGLSTPEWRAFIKETSAKVLMSISWYAASGQTEPIYSYDDLKKIGSYGAVAEIRTITFTPETEEP